MNCNSFASSQLAENNAKARSFFFTVSWIVGLQFSSLFSVFFTDPFLCLYAL
jgi:hypothetical protein